MARKLRTTLISGLLIGVAALAYTYASYYRFQETPLQTGETPVVYSVEPGSNIRRIARDWSELGWLEHHPRYLEVLARASGLAGRIQAGEYEFEPGLLPLDALDRLARGRVKQHQLTIVEGWSFAQLRAAVRSHPALHQTLDGESSISELMRAIDPQRTHPEGWFLPDTYSFPRGTDDLAFYRRAYQAMQDYLRQHWSGRDDNLPIDTIEEALTLASIVEKETAVASERARIAGVFIQRLRRKMRLQTDPTVIYGLGDRFDGDIRYRDLRTDTPYNTYTRAGLPPTPIAMPGRAAIQAVLHPDETGDLYFVARGDGTHQFSATLEAHNAAVDKYQRKR